MSPPDAAPSADNIRLRYTLTMQEAEWVFAQAVPMRENKLLHHTVVAGAALLAIHCATIGLWSGAAVFGTACIASLTRYSAQHSLIKFVFRGEVDYDFMADSEGIRGTQHSRMRIKRWSTTTQIEYQWTRLKSFMRVGDYRWLEFPSRRVFGFNMPTGVIIPLEAFATPDDLQRVEAWAEGGLRGGAA